MEQPAIETPKDADAAENFGIAEDHAQEQVSVKASRNGGVIETLREFELRFKVSGTGCLTPCCDWFKNVGLELEASPERCLNDWNRNVFGNIFEAI
ncbi:hypothetical protein ACH5RR_026077 [Cinchona calisaya]|uniref:Uncharacterized protein n=1 Tax=Cinchona calisaya TaxID=153742 RepID=A0ABD2Z4W0_9GENT